MSIGPAEILVVLLIALLVFGPNRLPEMARQVGRGMRELRRLQHSLRHDLDELLTEDQAANDNDDTEDDSDDDSEDGKGEDAGPMSAPPLSPGTGMGTAAMPPPGPTDRMPGEPAPEDTA